MINSKVFEEFDMYNDKVIANYDTSISKTLNVLQAVMAEKEEYVKNIQSSKVDCVMLITYLEKIDIAVTRCTADFEGGFIFYFDNIFLLNEEVMADLKEHFKDKYTFEWTIDALYIDYINRK